MVNRKQSSKKRSFLKKIVYTTVLLFLALISGTFIVIFLSGPPNLEKEHNTIYYSHTGTVIGNEQGLESRYAVSLNEIPDQLIQATLQVEDQHFYTHHGFDYKRIVRALLKNVQTRSLKEGASTLTQQYARNLYLSHEKTWVRKLKEAFYTLRLEAFYSKDEILEGYLNIIYYGHGAYGVEAASQTFFDKHVNELTLPEAAMLAGIPKGPTYYSPFNDEERAKNRQEKILRLLRNKKLITEAEYVLAKQSPLKYAPLKNKRTSEVGPYFQDIALNEASRLLDMPIDDIKTAGLHIYTTVDVPMQKQLEAHIERQIDSTSELEVGAIAMNPKTGAIKALVGGRSYVNSPFNRAVSARRMTGSSFKPFLYYTALNYGYTASTMLISKPTVFEMDNGKVYKPANFNDYYANKPITLAQALALSDNIYAVKTNVFLGPDKLVETAKQLGISSPLPAVPALALGSVSVSVNEMVTAYSIFANGGRTVKSYTIKEIVDRHGNTLYERKELVGKQMLDRKKTFIITDLMTGMFDDGWNDYMQVTGSAIADQLSRTYAGKSGTTKFDSWMIGFSPSLATAIWTGYDDNRPLTKTSETAYAKKIWAAFMEAAHKETRPESFPVPSGVIRVAIDPATGHIATPYCPTRQSVYFEEENKPNRYCQLHFHIEERSIEEQEDDEQSIIDRLLNILR
ncbi:transglycosylase domain-containing protein [Virgibacillus sp. W0430]|uniref:transglycosylase domain-containing protein n=1 Tax=Virgibacillus sp. W0430 TaxID=3391580 RepID=UPI003F46A933